MPEPTKAFEPLQVEEITQYVDEANCSDLIAKTSANAGSKAAPGVSFNSPS